MDGLRVAWRSWVTAHKFLFWAGVAAVARLWVELLHAIHWYQEASRELLVLQPRRPKDIYNSGYALFAYDMSVDCWIGHWRQPDARPGQPAAETFAWRESWTGVPFHEVEFSEMPEISFKVRAVPLAWCRKNLTVGEGAALIAAAGPQIVKAVEDAEALQRAKIAAEAVAESEQATKH